MFYSTNKILHGGHTPNDSWMRAKVNDRNPSAEATAVSWLQSTRIR